MTEIVIRHPANYAAERAYIIDIVFREFLGLQIIAVAEERSDVGISSPTCGGELRVADVLFQTPETNWLKPDSLPAVPLAECALPRFVAENKRLVFDSVPVVFGKPTASGEFISKRTNGIDLGLDVFGSAFFMLTRYEEYCSKQRDTFHRFPADAALASKAGFLERPLVNEYIEILRSCLTVLPMRLPSRPDGYKIQLSHDVDRVFDTYGMPWSQVVRNALGDVGKRRDASLASRRLWSKYHTSRGNFCYEPCNTFDFIMDSSERFGIESSFYFIPYQGGDGFDGDYEIMMPWIRELMRSIHDRGHEIGLHASFNSYADATQIANELSSLQTVAAEEGIHRESWGGRQHYLRWSVGETWQGWEEAGLQYDSTLAFPEAVGFRCGTGNEYPAFNLTSRMPLKLRERPLVAMETSLFSENYMNLADSEALEAIERLAETCRRFGSPFTLLWHNDNLATRRQKNLYLRVLEAIV